MSGSLPRLSVLMTVYNGGPYLAAAVASVLGGSWTDLELVVVDNVSTDGSREWLRRQTDPRLRLIENDVNLGQTGALQRGLLACRAPLVARLDADDLCEPDRFEAQIKALDDNPALALVGGQAVFIDQDDKVIGKSRLPVRDEEISAIMAVANPFIHSAVMFRRSCALDVGGYDASFAIAQDYALWSALLRAGHGLRNLPQAVCRLRFHAAQVTASGMRQREAPEALRITVLTQAWAMGADQGDDAIARTVHGLWHSGGEIDRQALGRFFRACTRFSAAQKAWLACLLAGGDRKGVKVLKLGLLAHAIALYPGVVLHSVFAKAILKIFIR